MKTIPWPIRATSHAVFTVNEDLTTTGAPDIDEEIIAYLDGELD